MKQYFIDSITPNKNVNSTTKNIIVMFWIALLAFYWTYSGSQYIPKPLDVAAAIKSLFAEHDFARDLMTSMILCFKAMFYSILFSLGIAYLSVIPLFRPMASFVAKARFLTTIGLTFIFAQVMADTAGQKMALLVFGISVFLETSALGVIMEVKKDDLDYARTLGMNEWEVVWEVIIKGKLDQMFEMVRQNFAIAWMMLAMVENICRAEGGIGVVLNDQNKHFHLDVVYAIQIIVLCVGIGLDWLLMNMRGWFFPHSVIKLSRK